MTHDEAGAIQKPTPTLLTALVAACATGAVWLGEQTLPAIAGERVLVLGGIAAVSLWALLLINRVNRNALRHARRSLDLVRQDQVAVPTSDKPDEIKRVGVLYVPAAVVLLAGLGFVGVLRFLPAPFAGIPGMPFPVWPTLAGIATLLLWTTGLSAITAGWKCRRLALETTVARQCTDLALDTMRLLPVMVSVCRPDGDRRRFNAKYKSFFGAEESSLKAHGWLSQVNHQDRDQLLQLILDQSRTHPADSFEAEYQLRGADGTNRWIREYFTPHSQERGPCTGYVVAGVDITSQVKNETDHAKVIEELADENEDLKARIEELTDTFSQQKCELEHHVDLLTKHREKVEKQIEGARNTAAEAKAKLQAAKDEAARAQAELKTAESEHDRTRKENAKLGQSLSQLQGVVENMQADEVRLQNRLERSEKQVQKSGESADDARRKETQLRTTVNRLTIRCQELEESLKEAESAREAEAGEVKATREAAGSESAARERALAGELQPRIGALHQIVEQLRDAELPDSELSTVESVQAAVTSIASMLEGALGGTGAAESPDTAGERSKLRQFDLRAAVKSMPDLLKPAIGERKIKVRGSVHSDFPAHVCGDPVQMRTAMVLLAEAALRVIEDGVVTVRLVPEGTTSTHTSAKCTITHDGKPFDHDQLAAAFGINESDEGDSTARQTAMAWRIVKAMDGTFGLEAPRDGGFSVWFKVTLARRASSLEGQAGGTRSRAGRSEMKKTAPAQQMKTPSISKLSGPALGMPVATPPSGPPKQGHRVPQELLSCNLGEVRELGPESIKVRSHKNLSNTVTIVIDADGEKLKLRAEVKSVEKLGTRAYDVLLDFVEMTPDQRQQIVQVAMSNRRLTMLPINSMGPK